MSGTGKWYERHVKKQCAKTPYTLIMEDVYSKEGGNSGNPVIGPDYYKIGSELGKQLAKEAAEKLELSQTGKNQSQIRMRSGD